MTAYSKVASLCLQIMHVDEMHEKAPLGLTVKTELKDTHIDIEKYSGLRNLSTI